MHNIQCSPHHPTNADVAAGIVIVGGTRDDNAATTAGMNKGKEVTGILHIHHDTHMSYTGANLAAREENEVAGLHVAALDGSVAGILVA